MSELDGAAPAAAEPIVASETSSEPIDTGVSNTAKAEPTPRGALDRAFASLEAEEAPAAEKPVETKTEGERPRGPDGKFLPKEAAADPAAPVVEKVETLVTEAPKTGTNFAEPPSRMSAEAKAAWATVPAPVQAEVYRAINELTGGIEKHREAAQKWESLKPLDNFCQQNGTSVSEALAKYIEADTNLGTDLIGGLEKIVGHYGYSLRDVASHVLGQPVDPNAQTSNTRALEQKIAQLEQELRGIPNTVQQHLTQYQTEQQKLSEVTAFKDANPRFDELAQDIAFFLRPDTNGNRRASTLQEAYDLANRLNPAPQAPTPATLAPTAEALAAQTRKGNLSLKGAPSSGSNPSNRKPPSSSREALDRAFAVSGLE